jgi:hypothetical protein
MRGDKMIARCKEKLSFLLVLALVVLFPMAAMAEVIEIDEQDGANMTEVTFTVYLNKPAQGADNLGMDITFDSETLKYVSADFKGTVLEGWDKKEVSNPEKGVLRLAASTGKNPITGGKAGQLVQIKFLVEGENDFDLAIKNLKGGAASWSTKSGKFRYFEIPAT